MRLSYTVEICNELGWNRAREEEKKKKKKKTE